MNITHVDDCEPFMGQIDGDHFPDFKMLNKDQLTQLIIKWSKDPSRNIPALRENPLYVSRIINHNIPDYFKRIVPNIPEDINICENSQSMICHLICTSGRFGRHMLYFRGGVLFKNGFIGFNNPVDIIRIEKIIMPDLTNLTSSQLIETSEKPTKRRKISPSVKLHVTTYDGSEETFWCDLINNGILSTPVIVKLNYTKLLPEHPEKIRVKLSIGNEYYNDDIIVCGNFCIASEELRNASGSGFIVEQSN